MKNRKHIFLYTLLIIIIILLTSCTQKTVSKEQVQEEFEHYTNTFFIEEIRENTLNLHYTLAYPENYGIDDYPITFGEFSSESFEASFDELETYKDELKTFEYIALTKEQQLTYDILLDYMDTELEARDLFLYTEILGPSLGYQSQLPILLAEYTFRRETDIKDYLNLLEQLDDFYEEIIEFQKDKSAAGLFMSDYLADEIILQCETFIGNSESNYLIELFDERIDQFPSLSTQSKESYKKVNKNIVETDVVNAYKILINGLKALKGTGRNEGGLSNYEYGKDYYEYLVKTSTGSSKSIPSLQKLTDDFIMKNINDMYSILVINPDLYTELDSYAFHLTDPDEILTDLSTKMSKDFPPLLDTNYTVKYVHESLEKNLSPAFYLTPPIDDMSENVIYINGKYSSYEIYTTLAHEGYPGHLYQTLYTTSKDLSLIRNLLSYSGYVEGWATYVEYYSYDLSGLNPNLSQLLKFNSAASLGLYAYIDMSVNYDGWGLNEVANYLHDYGIEDEEIIKEIFYAMVEAPANYLCYFIGYLEILELKEMAEDSLGKNFSLIEFHDSLLSIGPAPFYVIKEYLFEELN